MPTDISVEIIHKLFFKEITHESFRIEQYPKHPIRRKC